MEERIEANHQIMKQLKQIVEHPFSNIKNANNQGYFLMKGLEKVQGEFSISALVYNMKRVINILVVAGFQSIRERIAPCQALYRARTCNRVNFFDFLSSPSITISISKNI